MPNATSQEKLRSTPTSGVRPAGEALLFERFRGVTPLRGRKQIDGILLDRSVQIDRYERVLSGYTFFCAAGPNFRERPTPCGRP
jgi:hypothetical protein